MTGLAANSDLQGAFARHGSLEKLMDVFVKHQERVVRAVCDRFGRDLCFISVRDDALIRADVVAEDNLFQNVLIPRLKRMITPAREHGLPVALDMHTRAASLEQALPELYRAGINIIQFTNSDIGTLERLAQAWSGKVVFMGGLPVSRLGQLPRAEIDQKIRKYCQKFSGLAGFVFSPDALITSSDNFPPQHFTGMLHSIQLYGKY